MKQRGRPARDYTAEESKAIEVLESVRRTLDADDDEFNVEEYFNSLSIERPASPRTTSEDVE